ncbi:MAG: exodeoxyribonuclease VII large subunit [Holophaga sp.]|nr:exodeoxyribonuclease VII large subunit [Holophaga sp.]
MDTPISVKRLLEQVKSRLEPAFPAVCVLGEVSNFRGSGRHWYFTLKEEGAALQCAVWASQQRLLGHVPRDGERVQVKGALNLYVAGGTLTLAVTHCLPAGAGDLQARLRQLEAELRLEGLFDRPKRPLPRFPRRIGVVAALGGAALRDVVEVTGRRAPGIHLLIAPAAAQGERAVPENLLALQEIQDPFWDCEAILLVRGGGSLEDLWAFNDPALVRAVAQCRLPIVTGVGHEIDTTLVDLAADRRAATPSQAAELVSPDRDQLMSELRRRQEALAARMAWRLQGLESTLNLLTDSRGMRAVPERLERGSARLEALRHRLLRCGADGERAARFGFLAQRLQLAHPQRRLDLGANRLDLLRQRLRHASALAGRAADLPRLGEAGRRLGPAVDAVLEGRAHRLGLLAARLRAMNPNGPLERGFVLVRDLDGHPLTRSAQAGAGAQVELQWQDGRRRAELDVPRP